MKLELELVPKTAWYSNLRKHMSKSEWTKLSRKIRNAKDRTCELCGWKENNGKWTECHEVWSYDDNTYIQKLERFICLCPTCHHVKHWGLSNIIGRDMAALTVHAIDINQISVKEWIEHIKSATDTWNHRSQHNWNTIIDGYKDKVGISLKINNNTDIRLMEL